MAVLHGWPGSMGMFGAWVMFAAYVVLWVGNTSVRLTGWGVFWLVIFALFVSPSGSRK